MWFIKRTNNFKWSVARIARVHHDPHNNCNTFAWVIFNKIAPHSLSPITEMMLISFDVIINWLFFALPLHRYFLVGFISKFHFLLVGFYSSLCQSSDCHENDEHRRQCNSVLFSVTATSSGYFVLFVPCRFFSLSLQFHRWLRIFARQIDKLSFDRSLASCLREFEIQFYRSFVHTDHFQCVIIKRWIWKFIQSFFARFDRQSTQWYRNLSNFCILMNFSSNWIHIIKQLANIMQTVNESY